MRKTPEKQLCIPSTSHYSPCQCPRPPGRRGVWIYRLGGWEVTRSAMFNFARFRQGPNYPRNATFCRTRFSFTNQKYQQSFPLYFSSYTPHPPALVFALRHCVLFTFTSLVFVNAVELETSIPPTDWDLTLVVQTVNGDPSSFPRRDCTPRAPCRLTRRERAPFPSDHPGERPSPSPPLAASKNLAVDGASCVLGRETSPYAANIKSTASTATSSPARTPASFSPTTRSPSLNHHPLRRLIVVSVRDVSEDVKDGKLGWRGQGRDYLTMAKFTT
ncbi:hypothetical protein B0H34DRAFT_805327 [Crassisporium funariophilum]|nr:hypothetical protein B0H34DRAFT_805327 [Crassisporium funariophilum]